MSDLVTQTPWFWWAAAIILAAAGIAAAATYHDIKTEADRETRATGRLAPNSPLLDAAQLDAITDDLARTAEDQRWAGIEQEWRQFLDQFPTTHETL